MLFTAMLEVRSFDFKFVTIVKVTACDCWLVACNLTSENINYQMICTFWLDHDIKMLAINSGQCVSWQNSMTLTHKDSHTHTTAIFSASTTNTGHALCVQT